MSDPAPPDTPEEHLEIGELPAAGKLKTDPSFKEQAAKRIADKIVLIFAWAILGTLVMNFLLMVVLILAYKGSLEQIEGVVSKAIIPLLTATGTLASTLFGPLLAFILGYYFSQKHEEQNKPNPKGNGFR